MSDATPEGTRAILAAIEANTAALERNTAALDRAQARQAATGGGGAARGAGGAGGGLCFPNYGKSKNQPVMGATQQDLTYYASGAQRSLDDPGKERFWGKERALLDAINAELRRQAGGGQGQSDGGSGVPDFGGPPPGDDDIPFVHCGGTR